MGHRELIAGDSRPFLWRSRAPRSNCGKSRRAKAELPLDLHQGRCRPVRRMLPQLGHLASSSYDLEARCRWRWLRASFLPCRTNTAGRIGAVFFDGNVFARALGRSSLNASLGAAGAVGLSGPMAVSRWSSLSPLHLKAAYRAPGWSRLVRYRPEALSTFFHRECRFGASHAAAETAEEPVGFPSSFCHRPVRYRHPSTLVAAAPP